MGLVAEYFTRCGVVLSFIGGRADCATRGIAFLGIGNDDEFFWYENTPPRLASHTPAALCHSLMVAVTSWLENCDYVDNGDLFKSYIETGIR